MPASTPQEAEWAFCSGPYAADSNGCCGAHLSAASSPAPTAEESAIIALLWACQAVEVWPRRRTAVVRMDDSQPVPCSRAFRGTAYGPTGWHSSAEPLLQNVIGCEPCPCQSLQMTTAWPRAAHPSCEATAPRLRGGPAQARRTSAGEFSSLWSFRPKPAFSAACLPS